MSDTEHSASSDTKKQKLYASAIQKEMKNIEKAKKLLGVTSNEIFEEIPEIDEKFEETLKTAMDSIDAVNAKLSSVHKVYTKNVAPTTKKTNSRVSVSFKAHTPK